MKYISAKQILNGIVIGLYLFVNILMICQIKICESDFFFLIKNLYLAHEQKSFNNFYEAEPSDGIEKKGPEAS